MNTIIFMVSIALVLSVIFVFSYLWALSNGQFDDVSTPALRILKDDVLLNTNLKGKDKNENAKST